MAVLNRCEVEGAPGTVRQIAGTARLVGPGQFQVRLAGVPLPAKYWVLDISRDGRTLIVGDPNRLGGWVLRRDRYVCARDHGPWRATCSSATAMTSRRFSAAR